MFLLHGSLIFMNFFEQFFEQSGAAYCQQAGMLRVTPPIKAIDLDPPYSDNLWRNHPSLERHQKFIYGPVDNEVLVSEFIRHILALESR